MKIIEKTSEHTIYECPYCNSGKIMINRKSKHKYGDCDTCGATYIDYIPLPHQMDVHKSKAKFKLLVGGMGSAKSRCGVIEIIDHVLSVPNGHTFIMAQTLKQLSMAIMPIFDEYLPRKYVEKWTDTKAVIQIVLTNGHVIDGVPSDDAEKLRSTDITAFLIEEASGIDRTVFEECIHRLRNEHAIINGKQHFLGIIISNPAQGFIRELLFQSSHIYGSKSIKETVDMYNDRLKDVNPDLEAFLSSSRDNTHLPDGFVQRIINSSTPEQVRLYVDCIIEYAEGAVYPNFLSLLCDDFEIPKHWKRYMAHDPGTNDPAGVLIAAQDPETDILYFYKEYYKRDQVVSQVGLAIKDMIKDIPQGLLHIPLIDPAANKRNNINNRTYKQQLQIEFDLVFKDANNRIVDGIAKTRDMMYRGKIRIFRSLTNTIFEGCEYRYPTMEERKTNKNLGDNPIDKNNHLMDCMRYICQEVPYNFINLDRMNYNAMKKFFEKIGIETTSETHSEPKRFSNFLEENATVNPFKIPKPRTRRASGGFKL